MKVTPNDVINALILTLEKAPFIIVCGDKDKISATYSEKFEEFKSMFVELFNTYKNATANNGQHEVLTRDDCDLKKDDIYSVVEKVNLKKSQVVIDGNDCLALQ